MCGEDAGSMERTVEWIDPYEGFTHQTDTIVVSQSEHAEKLAACGLDARDPPSLFPNRSSRGPRLGEPLRLQRTPS